MNIHNTSECRSKEHSKKKMACSNSQYEQEKKIHFKNLSNYAIKVGTEKEIKKTLARHDAGYISSSDSDSD